MQIKDNITATSNPKNAESKEPTKVVKLRSKDNVSKNCDKIMEVTWSVENSETNEAVNNQPDVQNSVSQVSESEPSAEKSNEKVDLPLVSEEILKNKKDLLGIEAYNDIEAIETVSEGFRKLRVREDVIGNTNRARVVLGVIRPKDTKTFEETKNTVENSEINNKDSGYTGEMFNKTENDEYNINNEKLDQWLNKDTVSNDSVKSYDNSNINANSTVLDEISELQATRDKTFNSLASLKEQIVNLRKEIDQNKLLIEAKAEKLRQENMELTQDMNLLVAELNELTDVKNRQIDYLSDSNDKESAEKGMTF